MRKRATYQYLFRKSKEGEPLKLGITDDHYESSGDVLAALPDLYGKLYGRCWFSKRN